MKIEKKWFGGAALGFLLFAGCASHSYVSDDGYRHHRYERREYRHEYVGGAPGYYEGHGYQRPVEVYVTPEPVRPRRW